MSEDRLLTGRKGIFSSVSVAEINEETVPQMIAGAMGRHIQNRDDIQYLLNLFVGKVPILDRVKVIRPDVNNKIVINMPWAIVRQSNGYFLGSPIKYTSKNEKNQSAIDDLNKAFDAENKTSQDAQIGEWASICGSGYRLVFAEQSDDDMETPLQLAVLDPLNTFVIYSTSAGNKPLLGVTYEARLDSNGHNIGYRFYAYSKTQQYVYDVKSETARANSYVLVEDGVKPHLLGDVPIVEYLNNQWRMGDFEVVVGLLHSVNKLYSDRVNAVEQFVQSILVFINCDLKTAEENQAAGGDKVSDLDRLKENLAISITSVTGGGGTSAPADIKYVSSQLDQADTQVLADSLIQYVESVTGILSRSDRAGGGQDTGEAVYQRDGGKDLETVARIKEQYFKTAERRSLKLISQLLKVQSGIKVDPMNTEILFVRNASNDLLNKSTSISTLNAAEILAPTDVISLAGISNAPADMAKRGEAYWSGRRKADTSDKAGLGVGNPKPPVADVSAKPASAD